MTRLITFTDNNMTIAADICVASAIRNNVYEARVYRPKDIDAKFRKANAAILDAPRAGYWLWKPYIIDRELKKMKDGEYLIYADAGVEIVNNVNHIIDRMDKDIFLFGNMWQHVHWCKGDALMPNIDFYNDKYHYQVQASVIFIRNTSRARIFIEGWLHHCCKPGLIDDSQSKKPNHPDFKEHRHDQAILTSLAYLILMDKFHWWPAMYNAGHFTYEKAGYTDTYPVLFHHHRMRNNDFTATDDLNRHMQKYFKSKYEFV